MREMRHRSARRCRRTRRSGPVRDASGGVPPARGLNPSFRLLVRRRRIRRADSRAGARSLEAAPPTLQVAALKLQLARFRLDSTTLTLNPAALRLHSATRGLQRTSRGFPSLLV